MTLNPRYLFETEVADQPEGVKNAHRAAFQGLWDLNQAVASLKGQLTATQTTVSSVAATASASTGTVNTIIQSVDSTTHSEPLTDGNSNFIFAAGDIVVCVGVPN